MRNDKKILTTNQWGWIPPYGFLQSAELGFKYLLNKKNVGKISLFLPGTRILTKKLFDLNDGGLLKSSIFCIKHAIELLIKSLTIKIGGYYIGSGKNAHNLKYLVSDLEKNYIEYFINLHINLFKKIVSKYTTGVILRNNAVDDPYNTLLKYPEQKKNITPKFDYSEIHKLKRADINQYIRDIYNLKKLSSVLYGTAEYIISCKKNGWDTALAKKQMMKMKKLQMRCFKIFR